MAFRDAGKYFVTTLPNGLKKVKWSRLSCWPAVLQVKDRIHKFKSMYVSERIPSSTSDEFSRSVVFVMFLKLGKCLGKCLFLVLINNKHVCWDGSSGASKIFLYFVDAKKFFEEQKPKKFLVQIYCFYSECTQKKLISTTKLAVWLRHWLSGPQYYWLEAKQNENDLTTQYTFLFQWTISLFAFSQRKTSRENLSWSVRLEMPWRKRCQFKR